MISFVTASHDETILKNNLLKSILFADYNLIVQNGYSNVSKAYNRAKTTGDIIVYVHHDVFLPHDFYSNLQASIQAVNKIDENWGVLGCAGVKLTNGKREFKGFVKDRDVIIGTHIGLPAEVDTLDELLLITHGDLTFDEDLPQDFYGADICLKARQQGRKSYAINAFCHHNSSRIRGGRTESFYISKERFKDKWKKYLPIATTCTIVE